MFINMFISNLYGIVCKEACISHTGGFFILQHLGFWQSFTLPNPKRWFTDPTLGRITYPPYKNGIFEAGMIFRLSRLAGFSDRSLEDTQIQVGDLSQFSNCRMFTLQETNISPKKWHFESMIFLFPFGGICDHPLEGTTYCIQHVSKFRMIMRS